ncbi:MAG: ABC transporter substrate binding protein [Sideroxyarcus sp.]|nr:ABC transporter substrate binding protein [Sideroxyarcus sp.]
MPVFLCLSPVQAESLRIAVILSESGGAYQEFATALQSQLSEQHNLRVVRVGDTLPDADLVIAVGMKAANALAAASQPLLHVLIPRAGFEKLHPESSPLISAIYLDQPLERQLALVAAALPAAGNIGVLYAAHTAELDNLRKLSAAKKFALQEQPVDRDHPLASALSDLLEASEVLFVLPDAAVYSSDTIRNILLETYRKQVPMIGISPGYVRAGALCAVYSTPQQIARQAAEVIKQFAVSGKLPPGQYPNEFEVSVNTQVARSLGLVIKDAEQLRAEIRRKP